jgi:lipopolysaccharide export system permease protein
MKTVDRHLLAEFSRFFAFTTAVFLTLYLVVDFFEKLNLILKYKPAAVDTLLYFLARVPWMVTQVLPMSALVATLLSVSVLARRAEITSLRVSGLSLWRISFPYLLAGVALCLVHGVFQEFLAPPGFAWAHEVREVNIRNRPPRNVLRAENLWLKVGNRILHIDTVLPDGSRLFGVDVAEVEAGRMVRRIQSREARRDEESWMLIDAVERIYASDGTALQQRHPALAMGFVDQNEDFEVWQPEPEEASWADLRRWVERHRRQGINSRELEVDLWAKTGMPLASLVMVLLAFPLGTFAGRKGGATSVFVLALVFGFAYWIVFATSLSMGKAGTLPPPVAAWAGNLVFIGVAGVLVWRAERAG